MPEQPQVGVVVARLQVPRLHKMHCELLDYVTKNHLKSLVLLGVSPKLADRDDPFDFLTRKQMVEEAYPTAIVLPLPDSPSNEVWSQKVDELVATVFPKQSACIYGGRDSFKQYYFGRLPISSVPADVMTFDGASGTTIRDEMAAQPPIASEEFRAGITYALCNQPPRVYPTVDIAVLAQELATESHAILLGSKNRGGVLCLPGGFVDATDVTLEHAAARELREETRIVLGADEKLQFLCSQQIDDWRYTKSSKILTSLFVVHTKTQTAAVASDDLAEVGWYSFRNAAEWFARVGKAHRPLLQSVIGYLGASQRCGGLSELMSLAVAEAGITTGYTLKDGS